MALSQWDLKYLTPEEQQQVLNYQQQWTTNIDQRDSLHRAVEQIRSKYGYSGGTAGNQYIPVYNPPTAPTIQPYQSPYAGQIQDILDKLQNQQPYVSPYEDLINQTLSGIVNRQPFEYNPDNDPAYQAFLQRAMAAGEQAYAQNLGGLSAMTGGRPNSWAATVASQARNQYVLQAQYALPEYEERAYGRYQDETNNMYNLLNALNTQDQAAYTRYRDQIGDTKDLANMVMQLDSNEFEQYKFMAENQWKTFDYEYNAYKDSLEYRKDQISEAMDRTNMLGYVSNQDAVTLGVPAGTLSQGARERAEAMEDYIKKAQVDLNNKFKEMQKTHTYDLDIIKAKEQSELRMMKAQTQEDIKLASAKSKLTASRSSSGSGSSSKNSGYLTNTEINRINSGYKEFTSLVKSSEFKRKSGQGKHDAIAALLNKITANMNKNLYGKNSYQIGREILSQIQEDENFKTYYWNQEQVPTLNQQLNNMQYNLNTTDFLVRSYGGK